MKKIICIFLIVTVSILGAFELKLGRSLGGVHNVNGEGLSGYPIQIDTINTKASNTVSFEYLMPIATSLEAGFGIAYTQLGEPDKVTFTNGTSTEISNVEPYFDSIPIFATVKLTLGTEYGLYLRGSAGYAINIKNSDLTGTLDNGAHFGIGAGVQLYMLLLELAFEQTNAEYTNTTVPIPLDYQRLTLYIGARF